MAESAFQLSRKTGTFDFEAVREAVAGGRIPPAQVTLAALLLFAGAVGKSRRHARERSPVAVGRRLRRLHAVQAARQAFAHPQ